MRTPTMHTSILLLLISVAACQAQTSPVVSGPCDGCEALHEYGDKVLAPTDTLPGYHDNEPKLKLHGTVYEKDGRTPAAGVIIYVYHTNRAGAYERTGKETGWDKNHGSIRGWVRTGPDGRYAFHSFRPGAYPRFDEPEHIHMTVKEPNKNAYYLDDVFFEDDPRLTPAYRNKQPQRGGSGIVRPIMSNGVLLVERNIVLGKNIPNYDQ